MINILYNRNSFFLQYYVNMLIYKMYCHVCRLYHIE